ncbi:MAG: TIM barrel protein [Planctomycetaceae bacterium]|nr:TIM barrel protein [Planctomycetaceae bacterium]
MLRVFAVCALGLLATSSSIFAAEPLPTGRALFERDNLVAWCIVPFDAKKRGPEERAAMLERMGVKQLAYDYRAEHIPTFDAELDTLKKHGIELTAWWFPTSLNDEAKFILSVLERHKVRTQLWVTGGGGPTASSDEQRARVKAEAARIRPIADAAAKIGCRVALYNHGGWFGEPENQLEIIRELNLPNVGIVYNQHHGHEHLTQFPQLLQQMKPHLFALNLNGMTPAGDQKGMKIVPLGAGDLDLGLLKTIRDSGYAGPIGILNHTDEDAEARLLDNLDGLNWLLQQLDGKPAGPLPKWRSWTKPKPLAAVPTPSGLLVEGRAEYRRPPLTVECRATLTQSDQFNILVASDTKASGNHWELFTMAGNGRLTAYLPGRTPDHVRSEISICDGQPHTVAMQYEPTRVRLFVDGRQVADQDISDAGRAEVPGGLGIGRLVEGGLYCHGTIQWARLSRGIRPISVNPPDKATRDDATLGLWELAAATPSPAPAEIPVATAYDPAITAKLVAGSNAHGDGGRGALVFASARFACLSCHKIGEHGGAVGPELTAIGKQRTVEQLAESLLWPKREVKPEYVAWTVITDDGRSLRGYKLSDAGERFVLRDPSLGTIHDLAKNKIDELVESGTLMPDGLTTAMIAEQQQDVLRFVSRLGRDDGPSLSSVNEVLARSMVHGAVSFPFERGPLHPEDWPSWEAHVNRDRLYDFYAKEAEHFRQQPHPPLMVAEFPGLDGGVLGHWGNQNEQLWADERWNATDLGRLQAGIFRGNGATVPRGVCVRLGEQGELSACFNPETLTYDAVWSGGFVKFSSVRHGFMHGLEMNGTALAKPDGKKPTEPFLYHGFYRHGPRVVFAYRIGDVEYLDAPWVAAGKFQRVVAPVDSHPLRDAIKGGPRQWTWEWETAGQLGGGSPYAVDTIPLPFDNPWNALVFCGDHGVLPDGSAIVCTMQGDVWRATGVDAGLKSVKWTRFASGLHHALGLVVHDGAIYVQGRDQLTRLHDANGDGEADFYECFSNAFQTSPAGHDFICGLQRDQAGNFYTASGNQGLLKISPDGTKADVIATGFRNPDGLGLFPDGSLTVPCSEGDWTPASMICAVRPGVPSPSNAPYGGFQPPFYGYGGPKNGRAPDLPLVYLPRGLDNSSGGQAYIDSDRWGPLQGLALHLSFGAGSHFLLLKDEVDGQLQGAVVTLPGEFRSGAHRAKFNPHDGQLYVSGMAGWGSYTPDDGCFQRVRYTGRPVQLPTAFHVHQNGIRITFSSPVDASVAGQPNQHFAQGWNYRYSGGYGSAEFSTQHFGARGHDVLRIASATVLPDGRSLFLELPDLQPMSQLHLHLQPDGGHVNDLFATVHKLDDPFTAIPNYRPVAKTVAAHPILTDVSLATSRVPNPWLKRNKQARPVSIEAGKNLTFSTRSFTAKAGEALQLTLVNPDVVPHNWVLVKPGSLQRVGELANKLVADPEAVARHYVPKSDDVLLYTDIVPAHDEFTIWIKAPSQPGRYPYLCTFPGHWMVMNGELIVE